MTLNKLDHIAIATHNIYKSIDFFNKLGFKHNKIHTIHNQKLKIATIYFSNIYIELIESLSNNNIIKNFLKKKGSPIHHIAIETNNIIQDMQRLNNLGLIFLYDKPNIGLNNTKINFIHPKTSTNILIELVQKQ